MKQINLLYVAVAFTLIALWRIQMHYGRETLMFYGFAENKETEINLDHPVEVDRIFVVPGQRVSQGESLVEVSQVDLPLKINDLTHDIDQLRLEQEIWRADLRSAIIQLEAERREKVGERDTRIAQLIAERDLNRSLLRDLKSLPAADSSARVDPVDLRIAAIRQEIALLTEPLDIELRRLRAELNAGNHPRLVRVRKLENELAIYRQRSDKLFITAPYDGLIGNVHCKEAENVSAFTTLITFYEEKPTQVKGYVHESMILRVAVGDALEVQSSLHPDNRCLGRVTGLGSRIVEIPERLRKIPEIKTYGREVLIELPVDNRFMQKEKVVLDISSK